jgi:hypothetical protein
MKQLKILLSLAAILCVTAATTPTPANALFNATTAGATTGPLTPPASLDLAIGSATIQCASTATTKAAGFWTIQTSEETVVNDGKTKEQKQPPTKTGPHEAITIEKWGSCEAIVGTTHLSVTVSPCRLQIIQPTAGITKIPSTAKTASVQTNCVVVITSGGLNCTITTPQTKANHELTGITAENVPPNQIHVSANIPGITAFTNNTSLCANMGLPVETKGLTFKTGEGAGNEFIDLHLQQMI